MENTLIEVKDMTRKLQATTEKEQAGSHWALSYSCTVGCPSVAQLKQSEGSDMAPQP